MVEDLVERYKRLTRQLAAKWEAEIRKIDEAIKSYEKSVGQKFLSLAENELDAMEASLNRGDLASAEYHKMMAETYLRASRS